MAAAGRVLFICEICALFQLRNIVRLSPSFLLFETSPHCIACCIAAYCLSVQEVSSIIMGGSCGGTKRVAVQKSLFASFASKKAKRSPKIFCDLDGVLVDFDAGVRELTSSNNKHPANPKTKISTSAASQNLPPHLLWPRIHATPNFFRNLPWTVDGLELWEALRHLHPDILTGCSAASVASDKYAWCQRELCVEVTWRDMTAPKKQHARVFHQHNRPRTTTTKAASSTSKSPREEWKKAKSEAPCGGDKITTVITCWSQNKHCECRPGDVLIDDRAEKFKAAWEAAGGIFIHHIDTATTLYRLREKGILSTPPPPTNPTLPMAFSSSFSSRTPMMETVATTTPNTTASTSSDSVTTTTTTKTTSKEERLEIAISRTGERPLAATN